MSKDPDSKSEEKSPRPSPWILWALLLGLGCGLAFGEYCRPLQWVGQAYVKLLQMTVMPYIVVSLILGIGSLTGAQGRELVRKAGGLLLVFWVITLLTVMLLPLTFPHWESSAFFSSSLVEPPQTVDMLSLYIPSNPFRSLADNVVPAVVLFSILLGVALMSVKEKSTLLRGLTTATDALSRVTHLIMRLLPFGLFAIVASASGALTLEDLGRLQVYLVAYVVAALLLTFWVLPGLVTLFTPFSYREVVSLSRDALITAFVTGSVFVVLPVLTSRAKDLFRQRNLVRDTTEAYVDVVVPVSFNFPNVGELLQLVFILFAAWFSGSPVSAWQYPTLMPTGLLSFFGNANFAIPYLLDVLKLPADLFQLYMIAGLVTAWFTSLLAAMNLLVFSLLSVAMLTGVASFRRARLVAYLGVTAALVVALTVGLRLYFSQFVKNTFTMTEVVGRMHLLHEPLPARVHASPPPAPPHLPGKSRLYEIQERGFVRVGYLKDRLPYAFENAQGQLVGFDIEMAHDLARTLGVTLEFVPIDRERMAAQVNAGDCDVLMSGVAVTPERAATMGLSSSYRDETMAFIVPSHRRKEFGQRASVQALKGLRIAILRDQYFGEKLRSALPQATCVEILSPREFFEENQPGLDAFLFTAEAGSAWTLLHPKFAVVVPQPGLLSVPLAYAVARGDQEILDYLNAWVELKRKDGTTTRLYDYWILGRNAVEKKPRWSVVRNLFHWVN